MFTWIILVVLVVWCVYQRTRPEGKIEGQPLGMPRGTVRALITILIVSFPLQYIIFPGSIPGLILNALFIVVAFYFEARKPSEDRIKRIIREIKKPEKIEIEKEQKKPLYLPKYSVRSILLIILTILIILNLSRPFALSTTSTIVDIVLIIGFYMIGSLFRGIGISREKKKTKEQIRNMQDHESLSKYDIIEKLMVEKPGWLKRKGKSFLSLLMLIIVIVSLFGYSIGINLGFLLLMINIYYGIRD